MKQYIVIDIQDVFSNDKTSCDIDTITNYILNISPQNLTIIFDTINEDLHLQNSSEKFLNFIDEHSLNEDDIDESIYNLFKQGINDNIINYILNNGIDNIKIEPKEYGYIRHSIDNYPHIMYYISQLVKYIDEIYDDEIPSLENFKFIIENDERVRTLVNCCLNNNYYDIITLEDVMNFLNVNYLPYDNENRYNHLDKNDEIILIGGSAAECVLEEYLYLKVLGYNNVTIDKELIYGYYPDFEISSIDMQIENYKTQLLKETEKKFNMLSNIIEMNTNKTFGVER